MYLYLVCAFFIYTKENFALALCVPFTRKVHGYITLGRVSRKHHLKRLPWRWEIMHLTLKENMGEWARDLHGTGSCPISGLGVRGFEPSIFVTAYLLSFLIMNSNASSPSPQNPTPTLVAETVVGTKIQDLHPLILR
jgi:hypothetical protein